MNKHVVYIKWTPNRIFRNIANRDKLRRTTQLAPFTFRPRASGGSGILQRAVKRGPASSHRFSHPTWSGHWECCADNEKAIRTFSRFRWD